MDRSEWLKRQRRAVEEGYDTRWAPLYGEKYGRYPNASHLRYLHQFLSLLPQPTRILDAACGAGRYLPFLLEQGHSVLGIDQSQGMLDQARAKFPNAQLRKVGLQEMEFQEAFDGAICMDALEHVFPEDWPVVLGNFQRALKPRGCLYFTVEIAPQEEVEAGFKQGQQAGFPVVMGEVLEMDGVYHYYPSLEKVEAWTRQAGFELLEEGQGDGYQHMIMRKTGDDDA